MDLSFLPLIFVLLVIGAASFIAYEAGLKEGKEQGFNAPISVFIGVLKSKIESSMEELGNTEERLKLIAIEEDINRIETAMSNKQSMPAIWIDESMKRLENLYKARSELNQSTGYRLSKKAQEALSSCASAQVSKIFAAQTDWGVVEEVKSEYQEWTRQNLMRHLR